MAFMGPSLMQYVRFPFVWNVILVQALHQALQHGAGILYVDYPFRWIHEKLLVVDGHDFW